MPNAAQAIRDLLRQASTLIGFCPSVWSRRTSRFTILAVIIDARQQYKLRSTCIGPENSVEISGAALSHSKGPQLLPSRGTPLPPKRRNSCTAFSAPPDQGRIAAAVQFLINVPHPAELTHSSSGLLRPLDVLQFEVRQTAALQ